MSSLQSGKSLAYSIDILVIFQYNSGNMLEKVLDKGFSLLPAGLKRKLQPRSRIVSLSSTRPGELTSTPEKRRIAGILSDFVAGETPELPQATIVSEPQILNAGWLHPVQRLEDSEKERGLPIVGLEWVDKSLQGRPVPWCGPEMQKKGVRLLFPLPSKD